MHLVAIIQARMGSTRLPGKALIDICGRSMLDRVVRRARRSSLIDEIIVATTVGQGDDAIVDECEKLGVPVYRGSELDVLDRYYHAARESSADAVARITSDCPLIDPEVIDNVLGSFIKGRCDYASNTLSSTYPRGLDIEVFTLSALERSWHEASQDYQHVHVTPYIYQHPDLFKLLSIEGDKDYSHYRWTVDTKEDLDFVREVYSRIDRDDSFSWRDVLTLLEDEPGLAEINCHIRQKSLEEC